MSDEPREMDAEELLLDVELSKAISEAEKAAHEVRQAELDSMKKELEVLEARLNMEYQLGGVFSFSKSVTPRSVNKLLRYMRIWHDHDPSGEWTIYLNSTGGQIIHGMALVDELRSHSLLERGTHRITIKVRGIAASMAGVILQAADDRVIGPGAQLMIHEPSSTIMGTMHDIRAEHEWLERWWDQATKMFVDRGCRLSAEEIKARAHKHDWWLTAEEAVELGFADRVG